MQGKPRSRRRIVLALVVAVVSAGLSLVTGIGIVGRTARVVDVVALFSGGMAAGCSLVVAVRDLRASAQQHRLAGP